MAKGYTDWQQQVNISGQNNIPLISRPYIGPSQLTGIFRNVPALGTGILINKVGKGIMTGGFIYNVQAQTQRNDSITMIIDGGAAIIAQYVNSNNLNLIHPHSDFVYLVKYDNINFTYIYCFSPMITWTTSLLITYTETHNNAINIQGYFYYVDFP